MDPRIKAIDDVREIFSRAPQRPPPRTCPSCGAEHATLSPFCPSCDKRYDRRFARAVGYGPATLVRVQRFQRFLGLAEREPASPLGRLAAEAGYADQAHLTRECRRLSGLSPAALLAAGATPAGEKSDRFKPRGAQLATLAA